MAIAGLSARFSPKPELRARRIHFAATAKQLLGQDIGRVSLDNAQATILLMSVSTGESDFDAASIYSAVANRMVHILKLNAENETDDAITREVKLRVWWTCCILDTWSSRGASLSRQLVVDHRPGNGPRFPMEETLFHGLRPGDQEPQVRGRGFLACVAELIEIYAQIQDFHVKIATSQQWDDDAILAAVDGLAYQMRSLESSFASNMSYCPANLDWHISKGLGGVFLAFHLGYHHYCTLLFYMYLDQRRTEKAQLTLNCDDAAQACADKCKHHANMVSEILRTAREREGCELVYNIVTHVTIVSSSVLLHTYLFGDVEGLPAAKARLQSNFDTLVMLKQYWPSVETMTKRLVIFQDNCLKSTMREDTYRFDRWMMRFLLEHWLALDDKLEEVQSPWPDDAGVAPEVDNVQLQRSRVTNEIITSIQGF
ncbi:uncharacterized protein B0I36DRAFT_338254 [Microdochium trichocladiopsis]|uniref:Transcription factor domain-containing protein n=1 Tax=Microdochium trichocladiopsis TaxID=1682393 RepID=A0A9P8XRJ6_9PEZI|nr:uncharacterized protein B0I36DRAFT_338254 [Microdochium trichocladiopsis]KAH7014092.1 hypothetical protein B0I36DRAFT_338254 [Microdochium trichocladiopsis]